MDIFNDPIGTGSDGNAVYMKDVWPSREEIAAVIQQSVSSDMFKKCYADITKGSQKWQELKVAKSEVFKWNPASTYIHSPPFFAGMTNDLPKIEDITNAYCLLNVGDSVTTDHISPAGKIATISPAAKFLQ